MAPTWDSAGNICRGPSDPGCTAASPGLGTSPNPILKGIPRYRRSRVGEHKLPTTYQYSAGVQQALGRKTLLSLNYVGSQNRHMDYSQEINLPPFSALPGLMTSGGTGINQLYNYAGYGAIRMSENGQNGHYDAFQADLRGNVMPVLSFSTDHSTRSPRTCCGRVFS